VPESDSVFLATVVQIIPVLLLALVLEARTYRVTRVDAIAGVREARIEVRQSMHPLVYAMWRGYTAYRRSGFSTVVIATIAIGLALLEVVGLYVVASDMSIDRTLRSTFVVAVGIAVFFVAVKPVFAHMASQTNELVNLEEQITRERAERAAQEAEAASRSQRRRWWLPLRR
jgi:hypothetical protein